MCVRAHTHTNTHTRTRAHARTHTQTDRQKHTHTHTPWCCCHLRAWPMRTSKRDGGTTLTSVESILASSVRRDSLVAPASYASRESLPFTRESVCIHVSLSHKRHAPRKHIRTHQMGREARASRRMCRSGCSCFMVSMHSVCRSMALATSTSRSSSSSKMIWRACVHACVHA